jgi:hypothetical protein
VTVEWKIPNRAESGSAERNKKRQKEAKKERESRMTARLTSERAAVPPDRERLVQRVLGWADRLPSGTWDRDLLRDVAAALRSPADGWRTIESAPKDGTRVLVYRPRVVYDGITWMPEIDKDRWSGSSWWESRRIQQPTHWMPLPSPPAEEKTS